MNEHSPASLVPGMTGPLSRRMFLIAGAATAVTPLLLKIPSVDAAPVAQTDFGFPKPDLKGRYTKRIAFPVAGYTSWSDSFGACRDGGCARHHEGQDIFGKKHQKLLAAVSGTIVVLRHRNDGNSLYIKSDADGWFYGYLHINNDSPGTDDNRNVRSLAFAPHVALWSHVRQGQHIAYMGDSGNAEETGAHVHFEMRKPASSVWRSQAVNAKYSLQAAKKGRPAARPAVISAPHGSPPMRQGDRGLRVVALQRALNAGTGTHLTGDGAFGPATDGAVRRLQKWCRLTVDGVYGNKSQWALQVACNR